MIAYRKGIRACLWIGGLFSALSGLALVVWGILAVAGDQSGAVVARVVSLICGIAAGLDCIVLLVLLARLQLTMLDKEEPPGPGPVSHF